ncbi:MAG: radical SAM protein, partial [Nanoarchaeota archaeon]|nr:radical SAM protein [Nanoarchaeota archaeon]
LLEKSLSSPLDMYIALTKRCNNACRQCFMDAKTSDDKGRELSFSEIKKVVKQFSDAGGFYVRLTGGEPTVRDDFFDIVDLMNEEGFSLGLNTNGLFEKEKLDQILQRGVKDIRISLDGPEEINDRIRGKGTYKRIMNTLQHISEYNEEAAIPVQLTINVVLMKSNKAFIEEMIAIAQEYDAKISFGLLRLSGRAKKEDMLSPEEVVDAAYSVQQIRKKKGLSKNRVRINYDIFCEGSAENKGRIAGKYAPFPFDNTKCPIGANGLNLDAEGRVAPCGYIINVDNGRWVGESVREKDLLDIWHNSPTLNEARMVTRPLCRGCKYHITKCNGGCPVMAYAFGGNIDGKDPYCIRDVKLDENMREALEK